MVVKIPETRNLSIGGLNEPKRTVGFKRTLMLQLSELRLSNLGRTNKGKIP